MFRSVHATSGERESFERVCTPLRCACCLPLAVAVPVSCNAGSPRVCAGGGEVATFDRSVLLQHGSVASRARYSCKRPPKGVPYYGWLSQSYPSTSYDIILLYKYKPASYLAGTAVHSILAPMSSVVATGPRHLLLLGFEPRSKPV